MNIHRENILQHNQILIYTPVTNDQRNHWKQENNIEPLALTITGYQFIIFTTKTKKYTRFG